MILSPIPSHSKFLQIQLHLYYLTVVDDNVNEIEEAFTLIGELDVPEEFACFQTQKDEPGGVGGRMGAVKVLIDDNDC